MFTSSSRRALYTGITNNIYHRKEQHLESHNSTFAGRYRAFRLVYIEVFKYVKNAIACEKQIKGWTRAKKEGLVRSVNPQWLDLSADWGKQYQPDKQTARSFAPKDGAQDDKT